MKKTDIAFTIILLGAILIRIQLALYNQQSNDPHLPVTRYIIRHNELPQKNECWECFQPKLYYSSLAYLYQYTGLVDNADRDAQKVVAQLINAAAGSVTLVIIWLFLRRQKDIRDEARILVFSIWAFNPQLIGINIQATNDTLLILFCTLAIYCNYSV